MKKPLPFIPLLLALLLWVCTGSLLGQPCHVVSSANTMLPAGTGSLPPEANISAGGGSMLCATTMWGLACANITDVSNPHPYFIRQVGKSPGGSPQGVVPVRCDCPQGWNTMAVAEGPGGLMRMIGPWLPGGAVPPNPLPTRTRFSGLRAQLVKGNGVPPAFGQQINLPSVVPRGSLVAAIYFDTTGKMFGYFPLNDAPGVSGVYLADLTTSTGDPDPWPPTPIEVIPAIAWASPGNNGARLAAGYGLLVGATTFDLKMHDALLNATTGMPTELGSWPVSGVPEYIALGQLDGAVLILSAEGNASLRVYSVGGVVRAIVPGQIHRAILRGRVLFTLRSDPVTALSFIDVRSIDKVLAGDNSIALSVPHKGAPDASYVGLGFEASVNGSAAWLYRLVATAPEASVRTTTLDISCLQGGVPSNTPVVSTTRTTTPVPSRTTSRTLTPRPQTPTRSPTQGCNLFPGGRICSPTPTKAPSRSPSPITTASRTAISSFTPAPSRSATPVPPTSVRTVITIPNPTLPPITVVRPTQSIPPTAPVPVTASPVPTLIPCADGEFRLKVVYGGEVVAQKCMTPGPTLTPNPAPSPVPTSSGWTILPSGCAPKPTPTKGD